jgi:hypothetical protein
MSRKRSLRAELARAHRSLRHRGVHPLIIEEVITEHEGGWHSSAALHRTACPICLALWRRDLKERT